MTQTQSSEKSNRMVIWVALCLAVTFAASAAPDEASEAPQDERVADEVARSVDPVPPEATFPVPTTATTPPGQTDRQTTIPSGKIPDLDALLHLPRNFVSQEPRSVAGAGESVWRKRFEKADLDWTEATARLADTKRELEGVAEKGGGTRWSMAAPGGGDATSSSSPLSFRLRQQLRGDRERVTVTERAKRELQIEADLAGVPQRWRARSADSTRRGPN